MDLFGPWTRTDDSPKYYRESDYEFLDRAVGSDWDKVRILLNDWCARVDPLANLLEPLKSNVATQFQAAFWELYLHEVFHRLEFAVTLAPKVVRRGADPLTPDFLLESAGKRLYVEATVINDRQLAASQESAQVALQDDVNRRITDSGFMISMTILKQGATELTLPPSQVAKRINEWLSTLDTHRVFLFQRQNPAIDWPVHVWEENGWLIHFTALALEPDHQAGECARSIGLRTFALGSVDARKDPHDIRDRIRQKAKKYSVIDAPLIVAVLIERLGCSEADIRSALFGNVGLSEELLRTGCIDPTSRDDVDGVWATRQGPGYQTVSAVLTSRHFEPASVASATPTLWLNPWANLDVSGIFPWQSLQARPGLERLEYLEESRSSWEILGIPKTWPQSEAS